MLTGSVTGSCLARSCLDLHIVALGAVSSLVGTRVVVRQRSFRAGEHLHGSTTGSCVVWHDP
jgi:hypothetical protein